MDVKAACCIAFAGLSLLRPSPWAAAAQGLEPAEVSFTEIDQAVFTARQAIVLGRYDVAITTCERILHNDEHNLEALKIMGSAYYLLDEPDRAARVWKRALDIHPEDREILGFLSRVSESK